MADQLTIEPSVPGAEPSPAVPAAPTPDDARALERRGRRWLLWSFLACPCHLPLTMAVLATVFGGTAFGALLAANATAVGVVLGLVYAAGVAVGFRHLRAASRGYECSGDSCSIEG